MRRRESVISAETDSGLTKPLFWVRSNHHQPKSRDYETGHAVPQSDVNGGGLGLFLPLPDNFLTPSLGTPYLVQKFYEGINLLLRFVGYFFSPYPPQVFCYSRPPLSSYQPHTKSRSSLSPLISPLLLFSPSVQYLF